MFETTFNLQGMKINGYLQSTFGTIQKHTYKYVVIYCGNARTRIYTEFVMTSNVPQAHFQTAISSNQMTAHTIVGLAVNAIVSEIYDHSYLIYMTA